MTIQDQYTSSVRQATETWAGVAETFSDRLQKSFTQPTTGFEFPDVNATIDQLFDFWEKTLEVQRDVVKEFTGATIAVAERVRTQAETVTHALREQAETVSQAVREQAETAQRNAYEQAAKKYEGLNKSELQDELDSRDLPKTGNVDELRERLIADDQK